MKKAALTFFIIIFVFCEHKGGGFEFLGELSR